MASPFANMGRRRIIIVAPTLILASYDLAARQVYRKALINAELFVMALSSRVEDGHQMNSGGFQS